ncbi:MAG: biosynthetic peptidoglycan transglycosylase [Lachnospiraceae bacterium]
MKITTIIKRLVFLVMTVCICAGFVVIGKGYTVYRDAMETMSLEEKVASIQNKENFTEYEELPEVYVNAVVSVEDKRFYRHIGIDPIAICRALINDIKAGAYVEGGSTITQQLAKNMYFSQEKELTRKVAEVFVAFDLERNYSKEEIFELYVNTIYFGDGYYEVASASEGYFGKAPEEMTEYESTLLAGIPNAPSRYAPTKNPDLAAERQLRVLRRMEACGYFSAEEAETVAETAAAQLAMVP